jgi:hypothetical protein
MSPRAVTGQVWPLGGAPEPSPVVGALIDAAGWPPLGHGG